MKILPINIEKKEKSKPINNVYPFTDIPHQNKNERDCKSQNYKENTQEINSKKKFKKYTINLDWLQFVTKKTKVLNYKGYQSSNLILTEANNHNPNFSKCYVVTMLGTDICELHTNPTNKNHSNDEVLIKVNNGVLYTQNFITPVEAMMEELGLEFKRISRIDIALDGYDNLKLNNYIKRFTKTDTIQIGNDNLRIDGDNFNKKAVSFDTYSIGSKKRQKVARVYNKTEEISSSKKDYITKYWKLNNLNTEKEVGRFEIQLGHRHLRKYNITQLNTLDDIKFIGSIFKDEVEGWLKMYQVKKRDIKTHRKDIAIKKGKELKIFKWNHIPHESFGLKLMDVHPNKEHQAKRTVSFSLDHLISMYPNNCSTSGNTVNYIQTVTSNYDLDYFTSNKIKEKLGRAIHLNSIQKSFISTELKKIPLAQQIPVEPYLSEK